MGYRNGNGESGLTDPSRGDQSVNARARAKPTLQQLQQRYGTEAVAEAIELANEYNARDSLAYALTTLEDRLGAFDMPRSRNKQQTQQREPVTDNHALCDLCGRSFFVNDLSPLDGMGVCNDCRRERDQRERVQPPMLYFKPPNEAQRKWDRDRAEIVQRYEAVRATLLTADVCARIRQRAEHLRQGDDDTWKAIGAVGQAEWEICPEVCMARQRMERELRALGLRPLLPFREATEELPSSRTVRETQTGKRVAAYWASVEGKG